MKKKPTKRTRKPKTKYAVNRKPMSEKAKFTKWMLSTEPQILRNVFTSLFDELFWRTWEAALPKVRK